MEINRVYNENCLNTMAKMPDNFIDCVITSPPYYEKNIRGHNAKSSPLYKEFFVPFVKYADKFYFELFRVLKDKGIIFINFGYNVDTGWTIINDTILPARACFLLRDKIIWVKNNPEPNSNGGLTHSYEYIFVMSKGDRPVYKNISKGEYVKDVWFFNVADTKHTTEAGAYHGAIFPIELPAKCIHISTENSDIIYDPFMGTATTALACIRNGRKFIGSEINAEYCNYANKRIKQELSQIKLDLPEVTYKQGELAI